MKINKKILQITLVFVILISMLSVISTTKSVSNEINEMRAGNKGHKIIVYQPETMTLTEFEWSYVLHGFRYLFDEKNDWKKLEFHLYIDENEVDLKTTKEITYDEFGTKYETLWAYKTFESYYFEPGTYNWTITILNDDDLYWMDSHPLTVFEDGQQLIVYNPETMIISAGERSFVKHGWTSLTEEDYDNFKPYNVQVLINGEEIELYYIKESVETETEELYNLWFYQTFDANFFEPGVYEWKVIWSDITGVLLEYVCPLTVLSNGQRVNVLFPDTMAISESQPFYVQHGFVTLDPNDAFLHDQFDVQLFIDVGYDGDYTDDIEIPLQSQLSMEETDSGLSYLWHFTYYFEPSYFGPGHYNWRVVWSDYLGIIFESQQPFTVLEDGQGIVVYNPETMTCTTTQRTYVKHGYSFEGINQILEYLPINTQLFINEEEVDLDLTLEIDYSGEIPIYNYRYVQFFDTNYFVEEVYWWKMVWIDAVNGYYEDVFPLTVVEDGYRLNFYMNPEDTLYIRQGQKAWIRHGWYSDSYEKMYEIYSDWDFDCQFFVDNVELDTTQVFVYDEEAPLLRYTWWNYYYFKPNYFDVGTYEIKVYWHNETYEETVIKTLVVSEDGHQIEPVYNPTSLYFHTDQETFFRYSMQMLEDSFYYLPVEIMFFVDGVEKELEKAFVVAVIDGIEYYHWRFYQKFEAYCFEPRDYSIQVKVTVESGIEFFNEYYTMYVEY